VKLNTLIIALLFITPLLYSEKERLKTLPPEENKKSTKLLDANGLMKEIKAVKSMPNLLKSTRELKYLKESISKSKFYFQQTISVKRDSLISGDRVLWFKLPGHKTEIKLIFDKLQKNSFELINEHDFITAIVKYHNIGEYVEFKFERLVNIEPFNPKATMKNFHKEIDKFKLLKTKFKYTDFKEQLKVYSYKNKKTLGYLSGIVTSIKAKEKEVYMEMTINDYTAIIKCHPQYTKILADLDMNSKITMAALLDEVNEKRQAFFSRGCLTEWVDP
jgi:hypothetical protein